MNSHDLLKTAEKAALSAGKVLMHYFEKEIQVREKDGEGLVTIADVTAEKEALAVLRKDFPDFGILAEESGITKTQDDRGRWIIDPLDGTTNFVHRFPMFCVSIAAEWKGKLQAGVIFHPVLNDVYTATADGGAFLNGKPISVSSTEKLVDCLLTTGFTYRKDELLHMEMEAFERLSNVARAVRRPGSAALDLAYTARGVFDGFWERRLSPWDVAAGVLLVREAGGLVSSFNGQPYQLDHSEILASNQTLHGTMLQAIAPGECPLDT